MKPLPDAPSTGQAAAWTAITAARRLRRSPQTLDAGAYGLDRDGSLRLMNVEDDTAILYWSDRSGWTPAPALSAPQRDLLDLYLPLCNACPSHPICVGHLGQSLDGHIATVTGDSRYVTGQENILHMHRMRSLCDAILVGAATVAADDPRLTTRLVAGENPLRVILDPHRRLSPAHRVFSDGQAPTLLVCGESRLDDGERVGQARVLAIPECDGRLELAVLMSRLRQQGVYALFVEGGGITVSRFLQAGLLQRLQVAVAPLLIGSGRPAIRLPENTRLGECLRPDCRIFRMGEDVLFDCDLRTRQTASTSPDSPSVGLSRIC